MTTTQPVFDTLGKRMLFCLKVSRPGLWFQTLWLYVLPTAGLPVLHSPTFWLGLVYVLFPLNFLVYGWNDIVDEEIDRLNPRKDSFLFGARGTPQQLRSLPPVIIAVQIPFIVVFTLLDGPRMIALFALMIGINALYNLPRNGLRTTPPLELLNQLGYLLLLPLSIWINRTPNLPWPAIAYLVLFCTHSHLIGEIMDIIPDHAAGRRTSALLLGVQATKALVIVLVMVEGIVLCRVFADYVLGGFLFGGVGWLAFDLVWFRDKQYTRGQFRLLGLGLNAAGLASMVWVWNTGSLNHLP